MQSQQIKLVKKIILFVNNFANYYPLSILVYFVLIHDL